MNFKNKCQFIPHLKEGDFLTRQVKEHAEKHLEELNKYKNFVVDNFKDGYGCFKYKEPFIEELEVHDDFVPLTLDYTVDGIYENYN